MSDPHGPSTTIRYQLIQLLKIPVLPEGSFPSMLDQNVGTSDRDVTTFQEEFGPLVVAVEPLKHSNAAPREMERETIELFRKKCAGDIIRDGDRIRHVQLQINTLLVEPRNAQIRQSQIQNMLGHFKPICSPVRRLPPEILAVIFPFCLSANAGPYDGAPLVLCHISSRWRSVALASPQLWNRLSINFSRTSASKYDEISKFWFLYSRNQPRSLSLYHNHHHDHEALPGPQQVFTDIEISSRLLRTLSCRNFDPKQFLSFLQLPSSEVPLLEIVHLVSAIDFDDIIETTVLRAASRLRIVHLNLRAPLFMGTLPWSQLTWVKIEDTMNITDWAVALWQCVQLQYGYFNVEDISFEDFDWGNFSLNLERLETLILTISDAWFTFQNMLRDCNMPSLRHLSVTNQTYEVLPDVSFFHMTPCPNLSTLCFQNIYINQDSLTSVFTTTSTLERLALDISSFEYHSIPTLLHRNQEMLPHLSELCLVMAYDDVVSDPETICSAITSRFHDGYSSLSPLTHVSLFLWQDEDNIIGKDAFESAASVEADTIVAMIMNDPHSSSVDFGIRVVLQTPNLGDIVEKVWCEPLQVD